MQLRDGVFSLSAVPGLKGSRRSYIESFASHKKSVETVERLMEDYPRSRIARRISRGTVSLCHRGESSASPSLDSHTLSEFKEKVLATIERKAEAQADPVSCAVMLEGALGRVYTGIGLAEPACIYGRTGQYDQALSTAERIERTCWRSRVFSGIALADLEAGHEAEALSRARFVDDSCYVEKTWREIAGRHLEAGRYIQVVEVLKNLGGAPQE